VTSAITRKAFCARLTGATVVLLIQACGGGGDYSAAPAAPAPAGAGCTDAIAGNHGHVLTIATADLDSATDKAYDIQGSADHTHTVTLTVANLRALKAGTMVTVLTSTTLSHDHSVSVQCA